ncbi:uncharacterized protein [Periplaneta americana]|uniref:uncharacterized protein isoform X2 n=1 Tax=Periplaneta americana TaxID=6978 RepID=UPI0037E94390
MDVIKMEPALDLLDIQLHDNTYELEGNDPLSEEGNLSHVDVTGMKTECVDKSYNFKSEIKVEDTTPVAISLPMVKTEVDEDFFDVDRVQREQKVEVSSEKDEVLTESIGVPASGGSIAQDEWQQTYGKELKCNVRGKWIFDAVGHKNHVLSDSSFAMFVERIVCSCVTLRDMHKYTEATTHSVVMYVERNYGI